VFDDEIEKELLETSKTGQAPDNNDFMISEISPDNLEDGLKDDRRGVLFRYQDSD
jgi:hypothetical protein